MSEKFLTLEHPSNANEKPILSQLFELIEKHKATGIPISEEVIDKYKNHDSAAILMWAVSYKKSRTPELEENLVNSKDSEHFVIPYLKRFPDIKDGPLWKLATTHPQTAIRYAQIIVRGRFPEGEEAIIKSDYNDTYIEFLKQVRNTEE